MLFKTFTPEQLEGKEHIKFEGMMLFYEVNEDGIHGVRINAYHTMDNESHIQETFFDMTIENAQRFIADYSSESAEGYIKEFSIP